MRVAPSAVTFFRPTLFPAPLVVGRGDVVTSLSMSLLSEWNDRKRVSPHRPRRANTTRLVVVLVLVLIAFWLLNGIA